MTPAALQTAIYTRLSGYANLTALVDAIYDHTPQDPVYPFVMIGDDSSVQFRSRSSSGSDNTVVVHTWSRYRGRKEAKDIQRQVYLALHRYSLTVAGVDVIDCQFEFGDTFMDPDGITRHGIQQFRIILDEGDA